MVKKELISKEISKERGKSDLITLLLIYITLNKKKFSDFAWNHISNIIFLSGLWCIKSLFG